MHIFKYFISKYWFACNKIANLCNIYYKKAINWYKSKYQKKCAMCCEKINDYLICECSNEICFICIYDLTSFNCPFCREKMLNERKKKNFEQEYEDFLNFCI
jgi:hypothetical protein